MTSCCARCRRGMPGMGGGCGQPACNCHALVPQFDGERRSAPPSTEYTFSQEKPAESHERRTQ